MKRLNKAVSVLMSLITVFSVFAIVPLEVSAAEVLNISTVGGIPAHRKLKAKPESVQITRS